MNIKFCFYVLISCLMPCLANGVLVKNLYEVSTKVANQSISERNKGFSEALREVLVRASGDADVLKNDQIKQLLRSPTQFVQEYRYEQDTKHTNIEVQQTHKGNLVTVFNEIGLQKALFDSGVTVWPSNRPEVLIWLGVQERQSRYMMHKKRNRRIESSVSLAAKRRGLPIVWPLQSDIKLNKITVADLKGGFYEKAMEASRTYSVSAVAMVTLEQIGGYSWQLSCSLAIDGSQSDTKITQCPIAKGNRNEMINQAIDFITDGLAINYAVSSLEYQPEKIRVRVQGLENLSDYAKARKYLNDMVVVEKVAEVSLSNLVVDFFLQLRGQRVTFERMLDLDGVMHVVESLDTAPKDINHEGIINNNNISYASSLSKTEETANLDGSQRIHAINLESAPIPLKVDQSQASITELPREALLGETDTGKAKDQLEADPSEKHVTMLILELI